MTGYDGVEYQVGDRVELHPGTDYWMRGLRYGIVTGSSGTITWVKLDWGIDVPTEGNYRILSGPEDRFRNAKGPCECTNKQDGPCYGIDCDCHG